MANTYKSKNYLGGGRNRPSGEDSAQEMTATVTVADGVALGSGDVLKFGRLGENVRITQFQLEVDEFDSNATAAIAGKLGITASDACLLATATKLNGNGGAEKNFARVDGEGTAIDSFAVTPFPTQSTVQEIILTLTANPGTAYNTGNRNITLRYKYQYAYPNTYVTGVSDPTYPFAGDKVSEVAQVNDYNGLAG